MYQGGFNLIGSLLAIFFECSLLFTLHNLKAKGPSLRSIGINQFIFKSFSAIGLYIIAGLKILLGFLLIFPGIIWSLRYLHIGPIRVLEGLGIHETFKRSAELSKINRWRYIGSILVILFCISILLFIVFLLIGIIFSNNINDTKSNPLVMITFSVLSGLFNWLLVVNNYVAYRDAKDYAENLASEH